MAIHPLEYRCSSSRASCCQEKRSYDASEVNGQLGKGGSTVTSGYGAFPPPLESYTICDGNFSELPQVERVSLTSVRRSGRLIIVRTAETAQPANHGYMRSHRSNGRLQLRLYYSLHEEESSIAKAADLQHAPLCECVAHEKERPALAENNSSSTASPRSEKLNPIAAIVLQASPHPPSMRNPRIVGSSTSPAVAQCASVATRQEHHRRTQLVARATSPQRQCSIGHGPSLIISSKSAKLSCARTTLMLLHELRHRRGLHSDKAQSYSRHNPDPQINSKGDPHAQFVEIKEEHAVAADKLPAKEKPMVAESASELVEALEKVWQGDILQKAKERRRHELVLGHYVICTQDAAKSLPNSFINTLRPLSLLNV